MYLDDAVILVRLQGNLCLAAPILNRKFSLQETKGILENCAIQTMLATIILWMDENGKGGGTIVVS